MSSEYRSMRAELPAQVVELVDAFTNPIAQIEFLYLLANANILEPVLVDAETAARMVRPYSWFLDRVSPEGIKLTSAGYLPPADVEAASAELDLAAEWIGNITARYRPCPCWSCASRRCTWACSAKYRGMLLATLRGRKLRDDPLGLWWHLAEQLPPTKIARHVTHAGLLLLAATTIGSAAGDDPLEYVARMLDEIGWRNHDGTPLTKWQARDIAADTHIVLIRLGALVQAPQGLGPEQPTGDGAVFARAALRTWPA